MLDTDTASYIVKDRPLSRARMRLAMPEAVCLSVVSRSEMLYGLLRLPPEHSLHRRTQAVFESVRVLAWDEGAADQFAVLRHRLMSQGRGIGILDMMIAAHALAIGATLVTNNVRHFSRVEGLRIENWADADPHGT